MGISDFEQVSRHISKRFQKGIRPPKGGKHRLKVAGSLLRMDFKSEARTDIMRAVRKEKVLSDEQMFEFGVSHKEPALRVGAGREMATGQFSLLPVLHGQGPVLSLCKNPVNG